jgi:AmmeMemoRadiSam system protein A
MDVLDKKGKEYLLSVAKHSISFYLERLRKPNVRDIGFQGASFVTLMKKGELRGCIGTLEARQDLAGDVSENAMNAAFGDPRFGAVSKGELKDLSVEVSFLTPKERFTGTEAEFAAYISKERCGVIIERGWNRATFLPDVWKMLPGVNEFLTELSHKAGLGADGWKNCDWYTYKTIAFSRDWAKIRDYKD